MAGDRRTVLITGGTKGLGLAMARAFAAEGATLILTYRSDEDAARAAKQAIEAAGAACHTLALDFTEDDAPEILATQVRALTSEIGVYVHNAAATAFKPLLDLKPHQLQKTFNVTVFSLVRNVQNLVPLMARGGSIITVSGMDTLEAVPNHGALAAAKAALEMLTRYLGHELATRNIRVNGVNPGYVPTESTKKYFGPLFDAANEASRAISPTGTLADPKDIASVVAFLASEGARWMVGQTVVVDGGWTFASPALQFGRKPK